MEFIHSVLSQDEAVVAGTVVTYDLPVNPLSHALVTLKFAQNGVGDFDIPDWLDIPAMIAKLEVLYKGSAILSLSGYDLVACGIFVNDFESWSINNEGIDNDEKSFTFLVPMTRFLYSEHECFPRSTRGELVMQITYQTPFNEIDTVKAQIETIELPDASPSRFLRMTTLSATLVASGENDIDLPIGHPISDLVVWGGEIPLADADLATLAYMQLLMDNQRHYYSHTNFETIHNMAGRLRAAPGFYMDHRHLTSGQAVLTGRVLPYNHILQHYVHMPFDVTKDGKYILETAGKSDVTLRIGLDAVTTKTVRVIPCEIVSAGGGV